MATILLVEDELQLARVIAREVEAAGYEVRRAPDGAAALRLFAERAPDLVLLDWRLPGMDGLDVLRRLRQSSPVPVLMLTARAEEVDRVVGLEVGADDYLTKPFGMAELIARVRALLRRQERLEAMLAADRAHASTELRYGPLTLDPAAHTAELSGAALSLTRTELGLLHLLLRNRGRAFSRAYLHDAVWGEPAIDGDRSVDNVVLRLRRKLGRLGDAIETVWGVGYRCAADPSVPGASAVTGRGDAPGGDHFAGSDDPGSRAADRQSGRRAGGWLSQSERNARPDAAVGQGDR